MNDERIRAYRDAALAMTSGRFNFDISVAGEDEVASLGRALQDLGCYLEKKFAEIKALTTATEKINSALVVEDVFNYVYDSFKGLIPYDRIGVSLLDEDGATLRARWARSESSDMRINPGYSRSLQGSSLREIFRSGKPRIINNLVSYLESHPNSDSTSKIVEEGIRSSLTCPLIAMGKPIGVIFFSSMKPETYKDVHIDVYLQIAGQLSVIVEKSRMYQQLLDLNELKNKFLGIAAHDLRSPISAILASIEMILEGDYGPVSEPIKDALKVIETSSSGMLNLINDLLDVSAIESGHLELKVQPVDLDDFLQGCVSMGKHPAGKKSIRLELDYHQYLPKVLADHDKLKQAMSNLILNAINYSGRDTKITVSARPEGRYVVISVADQGQGIARDELKKLFKEFSKTSSRPTEGEASTGLGLAIVKRIVEAHGGKVWAESELKKGSTFYITVPVAPDDRTE
jgi:hypothetical protein